MPWLLLEDAPGTLRWLLACWEVVLLRPAFGREEDPAVASE
jgi:hypothetical protein